MQRAVAEVADFSDGGRKQRVGAADLDVPDRTDLPSDREKIRAGATRDPPAVANDERAVAEIADDEPQSILPNRSEADDFDGAGGAGLAGDRGR